MAPSTPVFAESVPKFSKGCASILKGFFYFINALLLV